MNNKKIEMSDDIQTPLLGGATAGNDSNLKNNYFNWSFESVFHYMKTLILGAEDRADPDGDAPKTLEEFLESLPRNVRKRVEVLQEIQAQHDELEAKYFEKMAALEAEFQNLYEPLYNKRSDIVNGVVEVEGVSSEATVDKKEEKGVPYFWLTAMKTNEVVADEIQERDEEALEYLKNIKWSRVEGLKGFKLEFFFEPNPYFKNTVLTKIYVMIDEAESILHQAIGTEIEWLPGKNLTQKVPREGSKNTKTERWESFFNFFNPPQVPDSKDDMDKKNARYLQGQMVQHYEVGTTIRDKIIPHAVSWFTGVADICVREGTDEDSEEDDTDTEDE